MTITSEIQRIKNNIANAYTACEEKGAVLPEIQSSGNLSNTISSIVQTSGSSSKYGLTMNNILGNVDSSGELQPVASGNLVADGIVKVDNGILAYKFTYHVEEDHGYYEGYDEFGNPIIYDPYKRVGLSTVSFPDLEYVGKKAMYHFLNFSNDLEEVSFDSLEEVGEDGLYYAFYNNKNLDVVSFPNLKTVGVNGCADTFSLCDITSVSFPELEEVNISGLNNMFNDNSHLTSISFPKLKKVYNDGLGFVCYYCSSLNTVTFEKLDDISEDRALRYAFGYCDNLSSLYFPSLTPNSFGRYTRQFENMLTGVSGCTVHFPARIKNTIKNWQDVLSGFDGTNTIILFDLNAATVNFVADSNTQIYIDSEIVSGNSIIVSLEDTEYLACNSTTNTYLWDTLTGLEENSTTTVNVDMTQNKHKITISTGISNLNVTFNISGINIPATAEASGKYSINYIGNNKTISYYVDGGNNYTDYQNTVTTNNQDITVNVSLSPATVTTFTRPNLTANGTMGGNSFAVSATDVVSNSYSAYKAVDGNTSDYTWLSDNSDDYCDYILYNPQPLKISQIVLSNTSTTYTATRHIISGSNDNQTWEEIATLTVTKALTQTLSVNSSRFYKYYKITLCGSSIRLKDIAITAQQKG